MIEPAPAPDSERVAAARARADDRLRRQRETLRPLGWAVTHVNRIFSKTGARDRAQAVRYAYRHGLA